ncbi:hypothetical protein MS3_00007886 [Schistosoma haematobium]|uniref:Uncharacterized protein n=2 Tax=Schistosoma haematobium TaxID=6185 RepID=A0A922LGF4_SCHHA|nr:hypothetical protein MS3_00007886 [Schistosoma haematobium]KAH9583515.1 hypothetical protein MS3_00007886 [Schistosoma haematobium]CAH8577811.1 unnamed protein product [Schistosoma haematobium]CAH8585534.1 unnamed protein product [Schistosoma haematobium]
MFPKGIQFANKPWKCAVELLHQILNHHPTIISLSGVHDIPSLTKLWEGFITDVKPRMVQPSTVYKLMREFLDTNFVEANIDFHTCLSSLLSANLFIRYNELDTYTLGLLISTIKEKCDHFVARRLFSHFYEPILSLKLNISEDGTYSISQMELINRLEQLTNYWVTYLSSEFPCNISKFDPAHFLFDWIRLAYCLTVSGIVHKRMNYFNVGVQFLVVIKSKNVQQYDSFIKYLIDELWNSLASLYLRATDLSSKSPLSGSEDSSNSANISSYIQGSADQDLVDSYYQEFGILLKLSRLTSNLNCSTKLVIDDQTLDKLTCLIFDRLATLCFYQSDITVYNHPFVYHALFSEEQSVSVNNWSEFLLKPLANFT